jgi:hypothetical protein
MAVKKMTPAQMKSDKKQDAKTMKSMSPAQKAKFVKGDKAMDKKGLTAKQDIKADKKLAMKVKKGK